MYNSGMKWSKQEGIFGNQHQESTLNSSNCKGRFIELWKSYLQVSAVYLMLRRQQFYKHEYIYMS